MNIIILLCALTLFEQKEKCDCCVQAINFTHPQPQTIENIMLHFPQNPSLNIEPEILVHNECSQQLSVTEPTDSFTQEINHKLPQVDKTIKKQKPLMPDCNAIKANFVDNQKNPVEKNQFENQDGKTQNFKDCKKPKPSGLLHFRKWWERIKVDISVNNNLISGVPIFIEENTLRVVNKNFSYFIPLEKVDFIRTDDGLDCCSLSEDTTTCCSTLQPSISDEKSNHKSTNKKTKNISVQE